MNSPLQLDHKTFQQIHTALSKCREFESDRQLRAVFNTKDLAPFKLGIEDTKDMPSRVDMFLDYILKQNHATKGPVLPLFLVHLGINSYAERALPW